MLINRNNYEEFLLLYVDNELSAADKACVDDFLQQNPDVQIELQHLQEAVLDIDNSIVFQEKNSLLLPTAIESSMLLLLDNELSKKEAAIVQQTIKQDNILANQFALLQQTKLSPTDDSIIFDNKERLYKKEKSKVVPFAWWKLAAAAILIGSGIWIGFKFYNTTPLPIETTKVPETKNTPSISSDSNNATAAPKNNLIDNNNTANNSTNNSPENDSPIKTESSTTNTNQLVTQKETNNTQKPAVNNLQEKGLENNSENNFQKSNNNDVVNVPPKNSLPIINEVVNTVTNNNSSATNNNNYSITPTSFTESSNTTLAFNDADDNNTKNKVGGFLRKAKRLLERKTKIGKGDNEIKIANLSFAVQ
jgi:hypothetical protein